MQKRRVSKKDWMHVPSHIGFGVIALVVMFVGLIVVTQYNTNNQTQTVQSHAATPIHQTGPITVTKNTQCISMTTTGKCVLYQTTTTIVNTKSPCISKNTVGQCTYYQNTTVNQNTSTTAPNTGTNTKPVTNPIVRPRSPINYGQSSSCQSIGGTCESKGNSKGVYHPGLCPGPASWQCFVPGSGRSTVVGGGGGTLITCGANAHRTASNTCMCNNGDVGNPQTGCAPFIGPIVCGANAHRTSSNTCMCNNGDVGNPQTGCAPFIGPRVNSAGQTVSFNCMGGSEKPPCQQPASSNASNTSTTNSGSNISVAPSQSVPNGSDNTSLLEQFIALFKHFLSLF